MTAIVVAVLGSLSERRGFNDKRNQSSHFQPQNCLDSLGYLREQEEKKKLWVIHSIYVKNTAGSIYTCHLQ